MRVLARADKLAFASVSAVDGAWGSRMSEAAALYSKGNMHKFDFTGRLSQNDRS